MTDWKRKLAAYLHDPPSKCVDIASHEDHAKILFRQAGFSDEEAQNYANHFAQPSDWVAAAAINRRTPLAPLIQSKVCSLTEVVKERNAHTPKPHGDISVLAATPELRFAEIEFDHTSYNASDRTSARRRMEQLLVAELAALHDAYELILFDCPPGISLFAEAAIELSEFIVIPTIPDYVSRLGIFAFRKRALRSMEQRRFTDERIWTLITKFEDHNTLHASEAAMLKEQFHVFDTRIPQAEQIARAAEWSEQKRTLAQKYGAAAQVIGTFAAEFRERAGLI
jgi:cellulose biosynthesis protein BcsQ